MIREVTCFQAQCDACGAVDDGGEFSAWSRPDDARATACDAGWTEIEVLVADDVSGPNVYRVTPMNGGAPYSSRSILLCEKHTGDGVLWCARCGDDLDESRWSITPDGRTITQTCPNRHANTLTLMDRESER